MKFRILKAPFEVAECRIALSNTRNSRTRDASRWLHALGCRKTGSFQLNGEVFVTPLPTEVSYSIKVEHHLVPATCQTESFDGAVDVVWDSGLRQRKELLYYLTIRVISTAFPEGDVFSPASKKAWLFPASRIDSCIFRRALRCSVLCRHRPGSGTQCYRKS